MEQLELFLNMSGTDRARMSASELEKVLSEAGRLLFKHGELEFAEGCEELMLNFGSWEHTGDSNFWADQFRRFKSRRQEIAAKENNT